MHRLISIIAASIVFGWLSVCSAQTATDRQTTLKSGLDKYSSPGAPLLVGGIVVGHRVTGFVPADVAKILEDHPREELFHYLSELRQKATPYGTHLVDYWIFIAKENFRGVPETMTCPHFGDSRAGQTEKIAVFRYTYSATPRPRS